MVLNTFVLFIAIIYTYKYLYIYHIYIIVTITALYNIYIIYTLLFLLLLLVELNFFKNQHTIKIIHIQLIVVFIFTLNQFYIFYNEILILYVSGINCLKVGGVIKLSFNFGSDILLPQGIGFKDTSSVYTNQISNINLSLGFDQNHSSFSKNISMSYLNTGEFYSYNAQLLTQPIFLLLLPLLTFQTIKLLLLFLKKNIINSF